MTEDAQAKSNSALSAYVPLVSAIFWSPKVSRQLKITFMWSLVMSRLIFNAHVVVPNARYLRVLNGVYMRALRCIAGLCRYGSELEKVSDLEVRGRLGAPSIDCILTKARLSYFRRVVKSALPSLLALLNTRVANQHLPWTKLIWDDMGQMRQALYECRLWPDPTLHSQFWVKCASDVSWLSLV